MFKLFLFFLGFYNYGTILLYLNYAKEYFSKNYYLFFSGECKKEDLVFYCYILIYLTQSGYILDII